jgi:uncharacterized membrane protein
VSALLTRPAARWLLLVSLALNLALLLALLLPRLGVGVPVQQPAEPRQSRSLPSPWALRAALDEDGRAIFNAVMQRHREPMRTAIRELRESRRSAEAAVRAEPFAAEALEQALAQLRQREAVATAVVHGLLVEAADELDAAQRAALADRLWTGGRGERGERRGQWRERAQRGDREAAEAEQRPVD